MTTLEHVSKPHIIEQNGYEHRLYVLSGPKVAQHIHALRDALVMEGFWVTSSTQPEEYVPENGKKDYIGKRPGAHYMVTAKRPVTKEAKEEHKRLIEFYSAPNMVALKPDAIFPDDPMNAA